MAASWNRTNKIGTELKFTVPENVRALRDKVLDFVESEVYPLEGLQRRSAPNAIKELQAKAKAAGLWALGHEL